MGIVHHTQFSNQSRPALSLDRRHHASNPGNAAISELANTLRALHKLLPRVCPRVAACLQNQPPCFQEMVNQKAIDAIESRFQIHVPEFVRLFYKFPGYALFIQAHYATDMFMEPHFNEQDPERPIVTKSAYPPWLAIGQAPESGLLLMVQLDSHVPKVAWRCLDPSSVDYIFPGTFQDWLLSSADDILRNSVDVCVECTKANQRKDT